MQLTSNTLATFESAVVLENTFNGEIGPGVPSTFVYLKTRCTREGLSDENARYVYHSFLCLPFVFSFAFVRNTLHLAIFRTVTMGWGVKALQRIPRGTFMGEYTGWVAFPVQWPVVAMLTLPFSRKVTNGCANRMSPSNTMYLFELDNAFYINGNYAGNFTRFIKWVNY